MSAGPPPAMTACGKGEAGYTRVQASYLLALLLTYLLVAHRRSEDVEEIFYCHLPSSRFDSQ